jgi:hypothetical protein
MPQRYDPLSQDDDSPIHDMELEDSDSLRAGLLPRPAVYYEEGPFETPSSEDEDESEVVEKNWLTESRRTRKLVRIRG